MKKIRLIVMSIVLMGLFGTGCGEGVDASKCRQSVMEELEAEEIQTIPGLDYRFIVRMDDGSIVYAETMGWNSSKVTSKSVLFPAPQ
jgi:hypothetical protein